MGHGRIGIVWTTWTWQTQKSASQLISQTGTPSWLPALLQETADRGLGRKPNIENSSSYQNEMVLGSGWYGSIGWRWIDLVARFCYRRRKSVNTCVFKKTPVFKGRMRPIHQFDIKEQKRKPGCSWGSLGPNWPTSLQKERRRQRFGIHFPSHH